MAEDKDYVCSLSLNSLRKATEELNETPDDRISAVQAFRLWIKEQPHIHWNQLDTNTLLVFLRGAKFSQIRARELLERHILMRQEAPEWFQQLDTHDEQIQLVLKAGIHLPLPKKDKDGRLILLQRVGAVDPQYKSGYSRMHNFRVGMLLSLYSQLSEDNQVNGTVFLLDFSATTSKHMRSMMSSADMKKFQKKWDQNTPGRFKKFIIYNAGGLLETLLAFTKPLMSKKHQQRLVVCDTAESLYRHVPMEILPNEYLPDDYTGPNAGSIEYLIENFRNEMNKPKMRELFLHKTSAENKIDISQKPPEEEVPKIYYRRMSVD